MESIVYGNTSTAGQTVIIDMLFIIKLSIVYGNTSTTGQTVIIDMLFYHEIICCLW